MRFPNLHHKIAILLICSSIATSQGGIQTPAARPPQVAVLDPDKPVVLDVTTGTLLGAKTGMDEAATRKALIENHLTDIRKVKYPNYFLLQACQGITFNFRGGAELNDIYTNSGLVTLSNGLKLGQPLKDFIFLFGKPVLRRLPSKIGNEYLFNLGGFELGVICLDKEEDVVRALSLRKRNSPRKDHTFTPSEA